MKNVELINENDKNLTIVILTNDDDFNRNQPAIFHGTTRRLLSLFCFYFQFDDTTLVFKEFPIAYTTTLRFLLMK